MTKFFILSVLGSSTGESNQTFRVPFVPDEIWISESRQKPLKIWVEEKNIENWLPDSQNYMIKINDDGTTSVIFGDGIRGARLPSGIENVVAVYRLEHFVQPVGQLDELCYGEALRARRLIRVRGVGHSFDGLYYIKSVTHRIDSTNYETDFTLKRINETNNQNDRISGNNFSLFYGRLLTAEGYNNEQKYFTENRKLINRLIKEHQNEYCLISILLRTIICFKWKIEETFSVTVYPNNKVVVKKKSGLLTVEAVSGIGLKRAKRLKKKGIDDIEEFYKTPAKKLGKILGISESRVQSMKKDNISLLAERPKDNRTDEKEKD